MEISHIAAESDDLHLAEAIAGAVRLPPASTPFRCLLPDIVRASFERVATRVARFRGLRVAYSVKTNPRREILHAAREAGCYAEVISHQERTTALDAGFSAPRIIYNGPSPLQHGPVYCAFADSPEAFNRYARDRVAAVIGIRYRPRGIASRFGVERSLFHQCLPLKDVTATGLSFHVRPEDLGTRTWLDIAQECVAAAEAFEDSSGAPLTVFDVGGGFTPRQLDDMLDRDMPLVHALAFERFGSLQEIVIEPGQGIVTPGEVVFSRILEIRTRCGRREAIVDASYPWFPQITSSPHRIYSVTNRSAHRLPPGEDTIAGSTCLEYDVVAQRIALPADCAAGDLVAIGDAGAYDASMAFAFARGSLLV